MTKDKALQFALAAMKEIIHWYAVRDRNDVLLNFVDQNPEIQKIMKTITAVEEALKTKDEPVAWGMKKDGVILDVICPAEHEREEGSYTTPLYTTLKRRWYGLNSDDMKDERTHNFDFIDGALWAEAMLKERNT